MDRKNLTGWNIRRIRIAKDMTVNQLASALPASAILSSGEIAEIELETRKVYDFEIQGIAKALGVTVADIYRTPPRKRLNVLRPPPKDIEAWKLLTQLEDIISGIEAQADNLGINLEEARHWWQKARRLIDGRNLALSKPSKVAGADPKSIPARKRRPKQEP